VLDTILVYWHSLAYLPKVILHKLRINILRFPWIAKSEKEIMALVRWDMLSKPKKIRDWGLKHIFHFGEDFVVKSLWKLLIGEGLWKRVIKRKYIKPLSMMSGLKYLKRDTKMPPFFGNP
jgi:hypothetical protein